MVSKVVVTPYYWHEEVRTRRKDSPGNYRITLKKVKAYRITVDGEMVDSLMSRRRANAVAKRIRKGEERMKIVIYTKSGAVHEIPLEGEETSAEVVARLESALARADFITLCFGSFIFFAREVEVIKVVD